MSESCWNCNKLEIEFTPKLQYPIEFCEFYEPEYFDGDVCIYYEENKDTLVIR